MSVLFSAPWNVSKKITWTALCGLWATARNEPLWKTRCTLRDWLNACALRRSLPTGKFWLARSDPLYAPELTRNSPLPGLPYAHAASDSNTHQWQRHWRRLFGL